MNNNEMKFDPQTGQPLQNNNLQQQTNEQVQVAQPQTLNVQAQVAQPQVTNGQTQVTQPNQPTIQQTAVGEVPTIEQSEKEFINNAQAVSSEVQEEKSGGLNYAFVIILFVIVLLAILFLFPLLT